MNYDVVLNANDSGTLDTEYAFTQGDYGQIQFSIRVKVDGDYISNAIRAYIVFELSNGMFVTGADMPKSVATYTYVFKGNELQSPGKVVADVKLVYADGRISSNKFSFICRYDPMADKKVQAGPYITALEKIISDGQQKIDYLQYLIDTLKNDIGGTPLTRSDLINNALTTIAGVGALDAAMGKTLQDQITKVNSDFIVQTISGTDLNNFTSDKMHWGMGYNLINAPWTRASTVEWIPYNDGNSYGVQRITSVQKVDGVYQSAVRMREDLIWSAWQIDSPTTDIKRFVLNDTVDFNQFAITKGDDGKYVLHFYKDGARIASIISS